MGGEVLELMNDRAARLEREAEKRGLEEGLEQGIEQGTQQGLEKGLEKGRELGIESIVKALKNRGVDAALIDEAVAAVRADALSEDQSQ